MGKTHTPTALTDFADTHDGEQAKAVYLAALKSETFADPLQPLQTFTDLRTALIQVADQPAKVIPVFEQYTAGMSDPQKLFVAERVKSYFANTVFNLDESDEERQGVTLTGIIEPLRAYISRLERAMLPQVANLRATLKNVFQSELERLPAMLDNLDDKDRLNFLCKILPFVLPKVEAVSATKDEPGQDFNFW